VSVNVSVNVSSYAYQAGQNPPPTVTLVVANPNATAVMVTGVQIVPTIVGQTGQALSIAPILPALGPGQNVTVPALGSLNLGPFPIVFASAANVNQFQMVNQVGNLNPVNPQLAELATYSISIGAIVSVSDGSNNTAVPAVLTVSPPSQPPLGTQGGFEIFSVSTNAGNWFFGVI
jgi:hypothetical protein